MPPVGQEAMKELLIKGWMTHDAMWFRHCVEFCGIDQANRVNRAAVRSMAAMEIRRLMKALGLGQVRSMDDLRELLAGALGLVHADFMGFRHSFPAPDVLRWDVPRCFAFDGVSQLGVIDRYQCGIFDRIEGWFDTLGLQYRVAPAVQGCLMHSEGRCFREYTFSFGPAAGG